LYWKESAELAGVCNAKSLAAFTEDERKRWLQLWADVDALLATAAARK